jgi:cytidylate kinase
MSMKLLTEYVRVKEQRLKIEKREKELDAAIKEALQRGERVKNHAKEAYLIDVNNRSITTDDFITTFDLQRFAAVAQVSVTRVDALIKLGALPEDDVARITQIKTSHRVGIRPL